MEGKSFARATALCTGSVIWAQHYSGNGTQTADGLWPTAYGLRLTAYGLRLTRYRHFETVAEDLLEGKSFARATALCTVVLPEFLTA